MGLYFPDAWMAKDAYTYMAGARDSRLAEGFRLAHGLTDSRARHGLGRCVSETGPSAREQRRLCQKLSYQKKSVSTRAARSAAMAADSAAYAAAQAAEAADADRQRERQRQWASWQPEQAETVRQAKSATVAVLAWRLLDDAGFLVPTKGQWDEAKRRAAQMLSARGGQVESAV